MGRCGGRVALLVILLVILAVGLLGAAGFALRRGQGMVGSAVDEGLPPSSD